MGSHYDALKEIGEPQVSANYARSFVDKAAIFLFGKSFEFKVPDEVQDKTLQVLNDVWADNEKDLLALQMATCGGVCGDVFIKVAWDEVEKRIRLLLLDPSMVFPIFNPSDISKIEKIKVSYIVMKMSERTWEYQKVDNIQPAVYSEIITPEEIVIMENDSEINRYANSLGEIPIVHIKNIPIPLKYFGASDLQDIITLNREYDEKITDISDIINYHAAPVTIVKGAKASTLEKGANKVWSGLPVNSDVFNLQMQSDLSASTEFLAGIKKTMFEMVGIPASSLGSEQAISNTSGLALQVQYQPLMEKTHIKQLTYGNAIKKINRLILKTSEAVTGIKLADDVEEENAPHIYKSDIIWPDPLPRDEQLTLSSVIQKISAGLQTKRDALLEIGIPQDQVDKKLLELEEEQKKAQETGMGQMPGEGGDFSSMFGGQQQQNQGNNPWNQSQKKDQSDLDNFTPAQNDRTGEINVPR
jgi:hypothetical protein